MYMICKKSTFRFGRKEPYPLPSAATPHWGAYCSAVDSPCLGIHGCFSRSLKWCSQLCHIRRHRKCCSSTLKLPQICVPLINAQSGTFALSFPRVRIDSLVSSVRRFMAEVQSFSWVCQLGGISCKCCRIMKEWRVCGNDELASERVGCTILIMDFC